MEIQSINQPLVVCAPGCNGTAACGDVGVDAIFQMPAVDNLRLDADGIGDEGVEYIAYRIVRSPTDLCNHIRRILLQDDIGDSDDLYAALLDLFIVLEKKGFALRKRVLEGAKSHLSNQQYRGLSACLKSDHVQCDELPASASSMLAKGLIGNCRLVEAVHDETELVRDPLIQAREHIEYCQIDQARAVLEQAILQQPQRIELHTDLLEIYQSTRDRDAFLTFWQRLNDSENPAPDVWQATADVFPASGSL